MRVSITKKVKLKPETFTRAKYLGLTILAALRLEIWPIISLPGIFFTKILVAGICTQHFVAVSNMKNHLEFPHQWCHRGRFHNSPYHRALWLLGQLLLLTWALLWDMISHMTHIWRRQTKSKLRISLSQSYAHFPNTKTRVRFPSSDQKLTRVSLN